jgi:hypothetical protein
LNRKVLLSSPVPFLGQNLIKEKTASSQQIRELPHLRSWVREASMISVPHQFKPLLARLSSATARPQTARRLILFFAAAILIIGDRNASGVTRLLDLLTPVNLSTFHRLFSHRKWSSRRFAKIIACFVIDCLHAEGTIRLVGDEAVDGRLGTVPRDGTK